MSRYKLWDGKEPIYTLVGEVLSAEEWSARYPWVKIPGVKMIIGGGVINGTIAQEFSSFVEMMTRQGFVRNPNWDDKETLHQIELWDDAKSVEAAMTFIDPNERIAAALELHNMLQLADIPVTRTTYAYSSRTFTPESKAFNRIKRNFETGLWNAGIIAEAVHKGFILPVEYQDITGERYVE